MSDQFIEVFEIESVPVGLLVEDGKVYLATPLESSRAGDQIGLYVPSELRARMKTIVFDDGSNVVYSLIEWTAEFDSAIRRTIDRLAALRRAHPRTMQLQLALEESEA